MPPSWAAPRGSGGSMSDDDVVHLRRRSVICSNDVSRERDPKDVEDLKQMVEAEVLGFVQEAVAGMNAKREARWSDPDFGPNKADPLGTKSLYRNARSSVPGYPKPEEVKWSRPGYSGGRGGEPAAAEGGDFFCDNAVLFKGDASKSTIIQGKLGNCWFLSAVAIAMGNPDLLKACFWRLDDFRAYGIYVVRFFKNGAWYYVVVDDSVPIFACDNGQPCFARCADRSELWLPLLEKAYAKLHFSYDSLAGGYLEVALREITGLCSERTLLRSVQQGKSGLDKGGARRSGSTAAATESAESGAVWRQVRENLDYGSVVGAIVQPEDGLSVTAQSSKTIAGERFEQGSSNGLVKNVDLGNSSSVAPASVHGIEKRHACGEVAARLVAGTKVLLLRNPWSFSRWLGAWSNISPEYKQHKSELELLFPAGELRDDAYFLISWSDFLANFTSIFTTVQTAAATLASAAPTAAGTVGRPVAVGSQWKGGYFCLGKWTEQTAGGGINKETWFLNPLFRMRVKEPQTRVFVQVFLHDRRMENSKYSNSTLFAFSLCEVDASKPGRPAVCPSTSSGGACLIPGSNPATAQPAYSFQPSCSKDLYLNCGDYALVPSTFDRGAVDSFCVFIFFDKPVFVDNALPLEGGSAPLAFNKLWNPLMGAQSWSAGGGDESMPEEVTSSSGGGGGSSDVAVAEESDPRAASERKMHAQRAEEIKAKLLAVAKERGINPRRVINAFQTDDMLDRFEFKQRMISLGYSVSEVPDKEFEVLAYPDAGIRCSKVRSLFEQDALRQALVESQPAPPADDLMFRPTTTAEGTLTIHAMGAQDLVVDSAKGAEGPGGTDEQASASLSAQWSMPSELSRVPVRVVWRSPIVAVSSRSVMIQVWQLTLVPGSPCVPIALDMENLQDFGFVDKPFVKAEPYQINEDSFWEQCCKEWVKLSLDFEPVPSKHATSAAADSKPVYIPNRAAYIRTVLQHEEDADDPLAQSSQDDAVELEEEDKRYVAAVTTQGRGKAGNGAVAGGQASNDLRNVVEDVVMHLRDDSAMLEQDIIRNEEFNKLKRLAKEKRRDAARRLALAAPGTVIGFGPAERDEYMNAPRAGTEGDQDAPPSPGASSSAGGMAGDSAASVVGMGEPADDVETFAKLFEDLVWSSVSDTICLGRAGDIKAGGWVNDPAVGGSGEDSSPETNIESRRRVFTRVVELPGQARVMKEQLSRSANIEAWFKQFDTDHSGTIDRSEFCQALEALGFSLSADDVSTLLMYLDKNGDGHIDHAEFVHFVRNDDDRSGVEEQLVTIEELLAAVASSTAPLTMEEPHWSIGRDWFKLRDFAAQLRAFTKHCPDVASRTIFALDARVAGARVYRLGHIFQTSERFTAFLLRARQWLATYGKGANSVLVSEPHLARSTLVTVLSSIKGVSDSSNGSSSSSQLDNAADKVVDIDAVMQALPQFVQDVLSSDASAIDGGIKADDFTRAVLLYHARKLVRDRLAASGELQGLPKAEVEAKESETLQQVQRELEEEEPSNGPGGANTNNALVLPLAEQLRMMVDDALMFCRAKRVNRSTIARMLNPDGMRRIQDRLRQCLQQQRKARDGPVPFLVDVFVKQGADADVGALRDGSLVSLEDAARRSLQQTATLTVRACDPLSGQVLTLQNVAISKDEEASLPPADSNWVMDGHAVDNSTSRFGPPQLWLPGSEASESAPHFLEELVSRLVVCKSANSGAENRLGLAIKEREPKVQFVRDMLASCSDLPFFYQVSAESVVFLVDQHAANKDCKNLVLDALRKQQGGRIAKALAALSSVLNVVFEQTHRDFREKMSWREFSAYLAERRNSVVEVRICPGGQSFLTGVAKDGGFNPVFDTTFKAKYTPDRVAHRSLVLTRVCKIAKRYMILFVHQLADENNRLGVVAYDPRSNDEFTLNVRVRKDARNSKAYRAAYAAELQKRGVLTIGDGGSGENRHSRGRSSSGGNSGSSGAKTAPGHHVGGDQGNLPGLQYWGSPKRRLRPGFSGRDTEVDARSGQEVLPREVLYEADTLRVIDMYQVHQDGPFDPLCLAGDFPLNDEHAWGKVLEHVELGTCLTPHVEFRAFSAVKGSDLETSGSSNSHIGTTRFPLSAVIDNAGKLVDRWVTIRDANGADRGQLRVALRFDDAKVADPNENAILDKVTGISSEGVRDGSNARVLGPESTPPEAADPWAAAESNPALFGDESMAPPMPAEVMAEAALVRASNAKDYSVLAQRLREEVLETKARLAESEKSRTNLERTVRVNEERLRSTRAEIESQRQKLDQAATLAREKEPRPPRRGARLEEFEEHTKLAREHSTKVRELEMLREENDRLRSATDAREARLNADLLAMRKKLSEAEIKIRMEVADKQELLSKVEKLNVDAQLDLAASAQRAAAASAWPARSQRSKSDRDKEKREREAILKEGLGKKYATYKREVDTCLYQVTSQLATRRPDNPEQVVGALEKLLLAAALPNAAGVTADSYVAADAFQETVLNFGLTVRPDEMEVMLTHFDTTGVNRICVEEFVDSLRESMYENPPAYNATTAGFRGKQALRKP